MTNIVAALIKHMHTLGGLQVGPDVSPRVMGVINVSPESYYSKSVILDSQAIGEAATQMETDGADYIDVGGMSTAPYRGLTISEQTEIDRIRSAVSHISDVCSLPISVDTHRGGVAQVALDTGATILNDVTGLQADPQMASVISKYDPSLILCAHHTGMVTGDIHSTAAILQQTIRRAISYGADPDDIVVDPAIGFFRDIGAGPVHTRIPGDWTRRDVSILSDLRSVGDGTPILVSVSSKSFIGKLLNKPDPKTRIYGSLAAETVAVLNGADIIRTHHVSESRDAVLVAAAVCGRMIS